MSQVICPAILRSRNPIVKTISLKVRNALIDLEIDPLVGLIGDRFILEVNHEIPYGNITPTRVFSTVEKLHLYDRHGNYVRADRLYHAIRYRKMGVLSYIGTPYQFQAVVGTDPERVNIICCLPRTNYSVEITESETTTTES